MESGTRDKNFDMVGCLYHALEGIAACMSYVDDAREAGDEEAAKFFEDVLWRHRQIADHAKALLHARLMKEESAQAKQLDEKVTRESEMSFPASDPPSH